MLKKSLICFSLISLLLLKQFCLYNKGFYTPHLFIDFAVFLSLYPLLGLLGLLIWQYFGRWRYPVFFVVILWAWNILIPYALKRLELPPFPLISIYISGTLALAFWFIFHRSSFIRVACKGLLIIAPLFLVLWASIFTKVLYLPKKTANLELASPTKKRLFVVLFDEWDSALTQAAFLPNIQDFASHSFIAKNAYPAGTDTAYSITSMTTGARIGGVTCRNGKWELHPLDGKSFFWNQSGNSLFSDLSERGLTQAAVGGLLGDYQRIFTSYLTHFDFEHEPISQMYFEELKKTASLFIPSLKHGLFSQLAKGCAIQHYKREVASLIRFAQDPNINFCFAHLQGAHHPSCYDRKKEDFKLFQKHFSYFDSLALIDKTIGYLKQKLQEAGLWDDTTIILTSDHWWRIYAAKAQQIPLLDSEWAYREEIDHRVPFIIKLAGEDRRFEFEEECSNSILRKLVNAFFDGQIVNNEELALFFSSQKIDIEKWADLKY